MITSKRTNPVASDVATPTARVSDTSLGSKYTTDLPAQSGVIIPAGSDFEVPARRSHRNTILLLYGTGGSGKTHMPMFFAPDPVAQINFDGRDKELVDNAVAAGRRIMRCAVPIPPNLSGVDTADVKRLARRLIDRAVNNLEAACESSLRGNVRTICFDTGTEFHELLLLAYYGSVNDTTNDDFGKTDARIKSEWWRIFRLVRQSNANLIMLCREKPVYRGREATGKFTFRGPSVIYDACDIAMEIRLKEKIVKRERMAQFEVEITKAGNNKPMLWTTWNEDEWGDNPFVFLCTLLTPGSSEKDWS